MEGATLSFDALHPDSAAHHLHQAFRNRKSQASAPKPARGGAVGLREGLEDALLLLRRDADARVLNHEMQHNPIWRAGLQGNLDANFALSSELDSVADQIDDNLPQPGGVGDQVFRHLRADVAGQFQTLLVGAEGQGLDGGHQAVPQSELDGIQLQLASFDFGEIEDIVDDGERSEEHTSELQSRQYL